MLLTHVTVRACLTDCTSAFMNCLSHLIVSFLVFFPSMILPPRGNLFFYGPLVYGIIQQSPRSRSAPLSIEAEQDADIWLIRCVDTLYQMYFDTDSFSRSGFGQ